MESLGLAMAEVGHDRRDQVHLQYQWVKLTCLQCCKQGYKTRNLHNKEVSRLAVSDCVASGNANENCLNTFQLERGRERSPGSRRMFAISF